MHVPAALPRVPLSPSTAPSVLPAPLPRVPNQPQQDPAPPAPAVDALPESPNTYQARTRNAGQWRRQRHKAQRAATKHFSSNHSLNIELKQAEITPRHQHYLGHCQSRQFRVCRTPTVSSRVYIRAHHPFLPACPCLLDRQRRC